MASMPESRVDRAALLPFLRPGECAPSRVLPALIALVLAAGLAFSPLSAAAASLEGSWSGSGKVKPASGQSEGVRCRVRYDRVSETIFRASATCASASLQIRQTGELVEVRPGYYVGDFHNAEYDISGRVKVNISGSSQTVTFSSENGSGSLSLSKN